MKNFILLILLIILTSYDSYSKDVSESIPYQISQNYIEAKNSLSCDHAKKRNLELSNKSQKQIQKEILDERTFLLQRISNTSNLDEREDLLSYDEFLENILKEKDLKIKLLQSLEKICHTTLPSIKFLGQSLSLVNTTLLNATLFPLGSMGHFFKGLLGNRQQESLSPRSDILYRILGPKRNISSYLVGSVSMYLSQFIWGLNPVTTAVQTSILVDMVSNYHCHQLENVDKKYTAFCKRHNAIKNFIYRGHEKSFNLGKRIQRSTDERKMTKRANFSYQKFCQFSKNKQVRYAKKALLRRNFFKDHNNIVDAQVLMPIDKNPCTKILLVTDREDEIQEIEHQFKNGVEGVQVVVLLKNKYPKDLYFDDEELSKLSLKEKICRDQERKNYAKITFDKKELYGSLVKSALSPGMLSIPNINEVNVLDHKVYKGNVKNLLNVIFTIGPIAQNQQDIEQIILNRKNLVKQLKKETQGLLKIKDYQKCLSFIEKKKINIDEILSISKEINEIDKNKEIKKLQELNGIQSSLKKVRKKLKLNWELIPTNNIEDILEAVSSRKIGNVVVVSHGKRSGYLVDVYQQEMPNSSFSHVSPTLMSLNFYSCHSQKMIQNYNLIEKFKRSESFYQTRYITTVLENDFLDSNSFAPVVGFGDYLFKLDQHLYLAKKGARDLQMMNMSSLKYKEYEKSCTIDLSQVQVEKGKYSVALNNNLVAMIDHFNTHGIENFNCEFLQQGENVLTIKNMINSSASSLSNKNNLSIQVEKKRITSQDAVLNLKSYLKFVFDY